MSSENVSGETKTVERDGTPENWEYVGTGDFNGDERYKNECGLWLVIEGEKVVTWVGNFHVAVRGTKKEIGQYESKEAAEMAAQKWMEGNPNPWGTEYE